MEFDAFFKRATGNDRPFDYQRRLATGDQFPSLVHAPTGAGKTAAAVLGWLWRRRHADAAIRQATPRRLVYCLPMRVLVEQTHHEVKKWLAEEPGEPILVHRLMGGSSPSEWDLHPEREAILIGTQDMLLSRALNRGYGASRYRWPIPFALLNNDCLWVMDEIQLMGSGLATTTQLQAFRSSDRGGTIGPARSMWMSATLRREWLGSVDFQPEVATLDCLAIDENKRTGELAKRYRARKPIEQATLEGKDKDRTKALAKLVRERHQDGSLTLVIVNVVERAQALFHALVAGNKGQSGVVADGPEVLLIHSRFRPVDREDRVRRLTEGLGDRGRIVVASQVIEAGVDVSAKTLFTELAPWGSLIQRFGRCNRRGEFADAKLCWIDLEPSKSGHLPYSERELQAARDVLLGGLMDDVGLESIDDHARDLTDAEKERFFLYHPSHVLRFKDLIDLFDTTPDLAGNDIDVSRFIRDGDDLDVQVFWREWTGGRGPEADQDIEPGREELCPVPAHQFRDFLDPKSKRRAYRWDGLEGSWRKVLANAVVPGQVYLLPADQGGYTPDSGWDARSTSPVIVIPDLELGRGPEPYWGDPASHDDDWRTIAEHTEDVCKKAKEIIAGLGSIEPWVETILGAARWHDWGKSHPSFQANIKAGLVPEGYLGRVGKAPGKAWRRDQVLDPPSLGERRRKQFRHELASALAMLQAGQPDLAVYLAAAHHGKVRMSLRSLPDEARPGGEGILFARGVWHGDKLPGVSLGDDHEMGEVELDLSPMELGERDGRPSWAERMTRLRDDLGPFRLAFLEAVLRAADIRASKGEGRRATDA